MSSSRTNRAAALPIAPFWMGPLAFLYTPIARRSIERGLPDGVDRLAAMAAADG